MKVDYYLPMVPLAEVAEHARRARDLGYDGIFSADTSHDPFFPLVVAAGEAPDLEVGTAIAVAFARSPMTVAYAAWDLAALTGGRFLLGLGTQIRAHVTRRFSMPWSSPGPRMGEYLRALRAIWASWQEGSPLRFEGEHYRFSLMTPFFSPGPIAQPHVPLYIAGVGEFMCRLAGELCDGFHVHPLHTVRYLTEVALPRMTEGADGAGRHIDDVERACAVLVATGRDESELQAATDAVRLQIAFYASTPAYRGVLELHGWDFGDELTAMSKRGEWGEMAALIDDEVVEEVAVVAPVEELGRRLLERYDGLLQRIGLYAPVAPALGEEGWAELVASIRGD